MKTVLGTEAVDCLAHNIGLVFPGFRAARFRDAAIDGLEALELMARGRHIASALHQSLPTDYATAVGILVDSLTPPRIEADSFGLAGLFHLPHSFFISEYGVDPRFNNGVDPFEISMEAQYALTTRFTAEFSIRPFLIDQLSRTLTRLLEWTTDPNPHVRRLCSEGTRPKLPWGIHIPALVADPRPALPILEALRDDPSLYVRRSVANHLGDIAKDHPELVFGICERWLDGASLERKWLIRHAVRYHAKKGDAEALRLRAAAK